MNSRGQHRRSHHAGFSLVELMIAMTIGLVMIAAAGYVYISSKRSYTTADGLARLQESTRGALLLMDSVIRNAGFLPDALYRPDPTQYFSNTILPGINTLAVYGGNGAPSFLPNASPYPSTTSDWIAVAFMGCAQTGALAGCLGDSTSFPATVYTGGSGIATTLRSCAGDKVPNIDVYPGKPTQIVVNVFFIGTDTAATAASIPISNLYCATQFYDVSNPVTPQALGAWTTSRLMQGVNNLSVLYGIDPQGLRQTGQYLQAGQMPAASWPLVSAVQINLTTQNASTVAVGSASNVKNIVGGFVQTQQTQTIAIRNRLK